MLKFLLDIIQTPAIVLGLVALIGLTLQRKAFSQIFSGTLKTALGMLVLSAYCYRDFTFCFIIY